MNITHLRYAVEVARTGSISQAAENLGVGQPNLSKALKELESNLGVVLFRRTSKGAVPTSQGQSFLLYARSLLSQLDEMKALFSPQQEDNAPLRIAATPSAVLALAMAAAAQALPDGRSLSLTECDAAGVIQAVDDGFCRLGLLRCPATEAERIVQQCAGKGLKALPLRHIPPVALLSRSHPLAQSRPLLFPELQPFVRLSGGETAAALTTAQLKRPPDPADTAAVWEIASPAVRLEVLGSRPDTYCFDEPLPSVLLERYGLCAHSCVGVDREWTDLRILPAGQELPADAGPLLDALANLWREASHAVTP